MWYGWSRCVRDNLNVEVNMLSSVRVKNIYISSCAPFSSPSSACYHGSVKFDRRLCGVRAACKCFVLRGRRRVKYWCLVANEQGKDSEGKSRICLNFGKCFLLTMMSIVLALYLARYKSAPFSKSLSLYTLIHLELRNICFL